MLRMYMVVISFLSAMFADLGLSVVKKHFVDTVFCARVTKFIGKDNRALRNKRNLWDFIHCIRN